MLNLLSAGIVIGTGVHGHVLANIPAVLGVLDEGVGLESGGGEVAVTGSRCDVR